LFKTVKPRLILYKEEKIMKVRPTLLVILTVIGVGSVAMLLVQRYNLFADKGIPVMSNSNQENATERETVLKSGQADNQRPSQQFSTPQIKSGQPKIIKPTSTRRDKIVKAEANSKIVDFAKPVADYSQSIEKFKLAVEEAESAIEDLEKIDY
jgi:hypothetical protein